MAGDGVLSTIGAGARRIAEAVSRETGGHLFVVHGRLESVVHDAAVIPVGEELDFAKHWRPVVGKHPPTPADGWAERGWGATDDPKVWVVNVGAERTLPVEQLAEHVAQAVTEIAEAELEPGRGRVRPLVALPFVGLEGGGHGDRRGDVIRAQIKKLRKVADRCGIDVAIVTPEASVYAAAQHLRRRLKHHGPKPLDLAARRLAERVRRGELALFLGAGVSVPAGLPSWGELLAKLRSRAELVDMDPAELDQLSPLDQAELIQLVDKKFQKRVAKAARKHRTPSLGHTLLAGLGCAEVVTTNYDSLYEEAVAASGCAVATVLPWDSAVGADRWVLKLHGDASKPSSIVLTRGDFVRYDAFSRPSGALLQALLLTRHLLFVGASLKDDNVIRLAREVEEYRREQGLAHGPFGTVLDVDGDLVRARLWDGQLDWIHLPGDSVPARARQLEILLDQVAMYASEDSSWLLDERFGGLLSGADRELAGEVRALAARVEQEGGPAWDGLVAALRRWGAGSP